MVADGFGVYSSLEGAASKTGRQQPLLPGQAPPPRRPNFTLASCCAHMRRKFFEIQKHYPEVAEILDAIADLYAIEALARVAAPIYSLIESADRCGFNLAAYLSIAARRALKDPKAVVLPFALPTHNELAKAAAKSA